MDERLQCLCVRALPLPEVTVADSSLAGVAVADSSLAGVAASGIIRSLTQKIGDFDQQMFFVFSLEVWGLTLFQQHYQARSFYLNTL